MTHSAYTARSDKLFLLMEMQFAAKASFSKWNNSIFLCVFRARNQRRDEMHTEQFEILGHFHEMNQKDNKT